MLEQVHSLGPVTALAFVSVSDRTILLAGEGRILKVFDYGEEKILARGVIFDTQAIHGIIPRERQSSDKELLELVVYGGLLIRRVYFELATRQIQCPAPPLPTTAWILHGSFDPYRSFREPATTAAPVALATSQNTLLLLNHQQTENASHLQELRIDDNSILYSAHVKWASHDVILVATGTAFGEVSVTSHEVQDRELLSTTRLLHISGAHEGSVFGVTISDACFFSPDGHATRLLASCSDDRTIRVWNIPGDTDEEDERDASSGKSLSSTRETGFGAQSHISSDGHTSKSLLAMAWAHGSRIWGVRFAEVAALGHVNDAGLALISHGEDATCQVWRFSATSTAKEAPLPRPKAHYSLEHQHTVSRHSGKNIWSMAVMSLGHKSALIATGGADGRIACFPLTENSTDLQEPTDRHDPVPPIMSPSSTLPAKGVSNGRVTQTGNAVHEDDHEQLSHSGRHSPIAAHRLHRSSFARPSIVGADLIKEAMTAKFNGTLRKYKYLDDQTLLASTDRGVILLGSCTFTHTASTTTLIAGKGSSGKAVLPGDDIVWSEVAQLDALMSYSLIATSAGCGISCIAAGNNSVYYLDRHGKRLDVLERGPHKVTNLLCQVLPDGLHIIISYLAIDIFSHWRVQTQDLPGRAVANNPRKLSQRPLPPHLVVTSMIIIEKAGLLILGARNGSLVMYHLSDTEDEDGESPAAIHRGIHEEDAVTSIMNLPPHEDTLSSHPFILTTGRDGSYAIHRITRTKGDPTSSESFDIATWHRSSPVFCSIIEGGHFDSSRELILHGFRGKHFVVWNETRQREIMTVDCGSAHRNWDFCPAASPADGGTFIWTQASSVFRYPQRHVAYRILQDGAHGREIKATALSPARETGPRSVVRLLATGAEDTTIRIVAVPEDLDARRAGDALGADQVAVLKKHTTGIQALRWSGCGDYLFSSGGAEEFFVWRIRHVPGLGIGVLCEAACPGQNDVPDVRITSFDASPVSACHGERGTAEKCFMISMAYSDSSVRVFNYSSTHRTFELVFRTICGTCSMTHASNWILDPCRYLFTATSNGHVVIYNMTSSATRGECVMDAPMHADGSEQAIASIAPDWVHRIKIHQNSVMCVRVIRLQAESALVLTAGDDNAVGLTRISFKDGATEPISSSTLLIKKAHACAVTSIVTIPSKQSSSDASEDDVTLRFATSSPDQRVKIWSIRLKLNDAEMSDADVRLEASAHTSVADVSGMDALLNPSGSCTIVLCGVGMDMWTVD